MHSALKFLFEVSNTFRRGNIKLNILQNTFVNFLPEAKFLVENVPLPLFKRFVVENNKIHDFNLKILNHVRKLEAENKVVPKSLCEAFLQLSKSPDTPEDVILAEIRLAFIAG